MTMIRRVGDGRPRQGWFRGDVRLQNPAQKIHASLVELEKRGLIAVDTENKTVTITDAGQAAAKPNGQVLKPMQEVLPKISLKSVSNGMLRVRAGFASLQEMMGRVHGQRAAFQDDLAEVERHIIEQRRELRFQMEAQGNDFAEPETGSSGEEGK
jgi:hypothetical protein